MSLIKNEKLENNKNALEIFIDAKTFQNACQKAYLKQGKRINIPGFRKGKAPKKVIEKFYGADVFYSSAVDLVYPSAVEEAIKEAKLDIVGVEKIEPLELNEETGCSIKVICVLKPEAEIENYKSIEVKAVERKVNEEAVQQQINILKERSGRLISVNDRAAAEGDIVLIDFEGFVDGKAFEGGSAKNHSLKLGSGQFINGFEAQVVGHKTGEEFEVDVVFPDNYHEASLKGKPAKFKCKINEIKVLQLPKEDDEFAKDVSKFNTLQELKSDIESNLAEQFKKQFDDQVDAEILEALASKVVVQIPELMLDNKTDELAKNFENGLARQGFTLDKYLNAVNISGYDLKDTLKMKADFQIRTDLALEKIAKLEKLEPEPADYDEERKNIAEVYKTSVDKIKNLFPDEVLKQQLQIRKAFDFVKKNAKVSVVSEDSAAANSSENSVSEEHTTKTAKTSQTKKSKSAKIDSEKVESKTKSAKASSVSTAKTPKAKTVASRSKSTKNKAEK